MLVKEVMTPQVQFVSSDDTIRQAALKMQELNVGSMPVVKDNNAIGIVTDRDIVIRSVAQGFDPEKHKIMEAFTEGIVSCKEDDDIQTVAGLMEDWKIRRLVVKDNQGKISGILSLGDLAVNLENQMSGEILEKISEPSRPAMA